MQLKLLLNLKMITKVTVDWSDTRMRRTIDQMQFGKAQFSYQSMFFGQRSFSKWMARAAVIICYLVGIDVNRWIDLWFIHGPLFLILMKMVELIFKVKLAFIYQRVLKFQEIIKISLDSKFSRKSFVPFLITQKKISQKKFAIDWTFVN